METVAGWFNLASLARVPRVRRLASDSFDFMLDSGIQRDAQELDALADEPLGAVAVDGKLVDKPIASMAQSVLDEVRVEAGAR